MRKYGFGLIDMLLGLLVITAVFMLGMSSFKNVSTINLNSANGNGKSVQQHVDETVNEIENMKLQSIEYQQKLLNENE